MLWPPCTMRRATTRPPRGTLLRRTRTAPPRTRTRPQRATLRTSNHRVQRSQPRLESPEVPPQLQTHTSAGRHGATQDAVLTVNYPGQDEKVNTEGKVAYETEDTGADEDVDKADQSETSH